MNSQSRRLSGVSGGGPAGDEGLGALLGCLFTLIVVSLAICVPYFPCLKSERVNEKLKKGSVCKKWSVAFSAGVLLSLSMCKILPETIDEYERWLREKDTVERVYRRILQATDDRLNFILNNEDGSRKLNVQPALSDKTDPLKKQSVCAEDDHACIRAKGGYAEKKESNKMEMSLNNPADMMDFPLVQIFYVVGFLLMLLIDQILFSPQYNKMEPKYDQVPSQRDIEDLTDNDNRSNNERSNNIYEGGNRDLQIRSGGGNDNHVMMVDLNSPYTAKSTPNPSYEPGDGYQQKSIGTDRDVHTDRNLNTNEGECPVTGEKEDKVATTISRVSMVLFGIIVLVHCVFDGMLIGMFSDPSEIISISMVVAVHKMAVAFAVGTFFTKEGVKFHNPLLLFFIFLFILSSPIGMVIGAGMNNSGAGLGLVICQSLAGGAFIYFAGSDLIKNEYRESQKEEEPRQKQIRRCITFSWVVAGFVIILLFYFAGSRYNKYSG